VQRMRLPRHIGTGKVSLPAVSTFVRASEVGLFYYY